MVSKTLDAIVAAAFGASVGVIAKAAGSEGPVTMQYVADAALVGGAVGATAMAGVYAAKALIQNLASYISQKR